MNAIRVKNSYKVVNNFIRNGGDTLLSESYNYIFNEYHIFLSNMHQSHITIVRKLESTYIFLHYIQDFKFLLFNLSNDDVYIYVRMLSSYAWGLRYLSYHKLYLRMFLNWAFDNDFSSISGHSVFPKIRVHRNTSIRTYYSIEEVNLLLNVIDIESSQGKEHFLILCIICFLGLRISDVVNLKLSNINFLHSTISLIQYKTKEPITLPLISQVKYPLLDYLKNVRPIDCDLDYVFVSTLKPYRHKQELKTHHHIVKKYLNLAEIDIHGRKSGFHALRHSFSTSLLSENIPLYSISKILGHTAVNTTMAYLDIDTSKLKLLALEVPYVKLF